MSQSIRSYQDLTVWQDGLALAASLYVVTRAFIQFRRIAQGSLKELETHLFLAERVNMLGAADLNEALEKCGSLGKRLRALIRSLQDKAGCEE